MNPRNGLLFLLALALAAPARGAIAAAQSPPSPPQPAAPKPTASRQGEGGRLLEAVRRNPDSFEAHRALAGHYLQQGKLEAAIPYLDRARTIDPAHYANGYDLAAALLETGNLNLAREQIERMLGAKETPELLNLLGDVYERADNRVAAAEPYQRAARMDPTEEHLFDWGNNLLRLRAYGSDTAKPFVAHTRPPVTCRTKARRALSVRQSQASTRRRSAISGASLSPVRRCTSRQIAMPGLREGMSVSRPRK